MPNFTTVLNRLYQAAMQNAKLPGVKGALFRKAVETKLHYLHTTGVNTHKLWDALIFRKVGSGDHNPAVMFVDVSRAIRCKLFSAEEFGTSSAGQRLSARIAWTSSRSPSHVQCSKVRSPPSPQLHEVVV
jgi:hypothetical protein